MNKPRRECGSCRHWHKCLRDGRGICDKLDCAGKAEDGKRCPKWEGRKYKDTGHDGLLDLEWDNL